AVSFGSKSACRDRLTTAMSCQSTMFPIAVVAVSHEFDIALTPFAWQHAPTTLPHRILFWFHTYFVAAEGVNVHQLPRRDVMSYVLQIWDQPTEIALPTNVEEALSLVDKLLNSTAPQNPIYLSFAQRLTARYPCICSPETKALPKKEWVWGDGPLDGVTTDGAYGISIKSALVNKVKPFVLIEAAALGLNVLDEQSGEVHLSNGTTLSSRTVYARLLDAQEANRRGNYAYAFSEYLEMAQSGVATAQYSLGTMCERGRGIAVDIELAVAWYRKAAEQGNEMAQYWLGFLHHQGRKVKQDYKEALSWFRLAAAQRHAEAERRLGDMYSYGQCVEKDLVEAAKWYKSSAEHGDAAGQLSLGLAYLNGEGVDKDNAEAKKWIRSAAANGDNIAFFTMGRLYLRGQVVPISRVTAHALLYFAAIRTPFFSEDAANLSPPDRLSPEELKAANSLMASMDRAKNPLLALEKKVGRIDQE
ncbi:tetratricopeptide repeat protein, partial [Collimonas silvisoli]|uniref:tetratricopeptide repeat protein n=1 Tax=Collimonas silvisoli TaxID=2825884 RepID=UPI001B8DA3E2